MRFIIDLFCNLNNIFPEFKMILRQFSLIYLIIIISVSSVSSHQSNRWYWTWSCNNNSGQCVKSTEPVPTNISPSEDQFVSQQVCRLICGKYGALWPVPTISTFIDKKLIFFHPSNINFNFEGNEQSTIFFEELTSIFKSNILKECEEDCNVGSERYINIFVNIQNHNLNLNPETDESYSLEITTTDLGTTVKIISDNLFGARHGLETLSQLIASYNLPNSNFERQVGLAMVANAKIKDKPIYKHRGLLLDTARNYLPVHSIKKQIDAMAASKMNVLHWHATDSQSFPIESKRVPQMAKYGAYSSSKIYSLEVLTSLTNYARVRGVRILLELDAPSHAGQGWQWGPSYGLGDLAVCVNQQPWRQFCIQPPCGQLNPANLNVYNVLKDLYKDFVETGSEGSLFHMGGDEVFINCWNTTQEILSYMSQKGWGRSTEDFLKLWSEFQKRNLETFDTVVGNSNTPIILWSSQLTEPDIIEKYLPKNRYIIQTWVPTTNDMPARLLEKGYRLIMSTKNAWYMDHGFWGSTQYYQWRTVYKNRLPRHRNVLGGEACMWGEYVDKSSIDARIWPRLAAVAERLWSDPDFDTGAVETRFYRHRDRLVSRGISADALAPGWCFLNEGECR